MCVRLKTVRAAGIAIKNHLVVAIDPTTVARLYMNFQTKNPNLGKFWMALQGKMYILWSFGQFPPILWSFGKFCGPLVYFPPFWYVVPNKSGNRGSLSNNQYRNPKSAPSKSLNFLHWQKNGKRRKKVNFLRPEWKQKCFSLKRATLEREPLSIKLGPEAEAAAAVAGRFAFVGEAKRVQRGTQGLGGGRGGIDYRLCNYSGQKMAPHIRILCEAFKKSGIRYIHMYIHSYVSTSDISIWN
jgi:hypothetical protein